MALNPIKLTSYSSAALLFSTLAPAVWAQGAAPAIVPTGDAAPAAAAVPNPVAPALPAAAARPMIDLRFRDVEVTELINIISDQFNVPILVSGDVGGRISYINLTNKSPESAIQAIVTVAGLKYRKQADGTFLIGKDLVEETTPATPSINPTDNSFGAGLPISPLNNGALPSFGGSSTGGSNAFDIPELINNDGNSTSKKRGVPLKVRNVSASMMAYWLDPANHDLPIEFQASEMNRDRYGTQPIAKNALGPTDQLLSQGVAGVSNSSPLASPYSGPQFNTNPYTNRSNAEMRANAQFGGGGGGFGNNNGGGGGFGNNNGGGRNNNGGGRNGGRGGANGGVFPLPEGVDRIVAIDPQNALLVFGTDEGVRELQDTIAILDRPLKQVEIEAQFVSVSTADSRNFGIDFSTAQGNFSASNNGFAPGIGQGSFQVGFVRANFQATLNALLTKNRAKVITAPRVTAINNLTASLVSSESRPIILTTAVQGGGLNGGQAQGQNLLYITTAIGLTVTPTINNDDTITVLMQPQLQSQTILPDIAAPVITSQELETIANVRDGDTIALGGLRRKDISRGGSKIPLLGDLPLGLGKLFRSRSAVDNESELIIFLTARIIRRAGDDDVVPGT